MANENKEKKTGRFGQFFKEVSGEVKKLSWPTKKEIVSYTLTVIAFILLMAVVIYALDLVFGEGLGLLGGLLVELLAEAHDVHAVLAQSRTYWRSGCCLAGGDLQLYVAGDLLCHCVSFLLYIVVRAAGHGAACLPLMQAQIRIHTNWVVGGLPLNFLKIYIFWTAI